jgi:hypothetical protein
MKKHIPILFSTPMVQAIQEERKTVTRRTTKLERVNEDPDQWTFLGLRMNNGDRRLWAFFENKKEDFSVAIPCPYGIVEDVLWVRETWFPTKISDILNKDTGLPYAYKADVTIKEAKKAKETMEEYGWKWNPSIHMPMDAARIFLETIDIKIERLHNITQQEAINEGVEDLKLYPEMEGTYKNYFTKEPSCFYNPIHSFMSLWESINGAMSYAKNPWVWAVSFKRIDKPVDF